MNRVLKKALSFFSAVAVSVSVLAAGAVSAQAASSVKLKQVIPNSYAGVIDMSGPALFVSSYNGKNEIDVSSPKTEIVMLTDSGKKVTIKNSIGFEKMFVTSSGYNMDTWPLGNQFYYLSSPYPVVTLQKGNKYAALLGNGEYLEGGKLFKRVNVADGCITAVSGKTTYVYDFNGQKIMKMNIKPQVICIGYDSSTKTVIARDVEGVKTAENNYWPTYNYYMIRKGKIVSTISGHDKEYEFQKANNKTYLTFWSDEERGYIYYSMKGNKATDLDGEHFSFSARTAQSKEAPVYLNRDFDNEKFYIKNSATDKVLKTYPAKYPYTPSISPLQNGKFSFVSCNKDMSKFGCLVF